MLKKIIKKELLKRNAVFAVCFTVTMTFILGNTNSFVSAKSTYSNLQQYEYTADTITLIDKYQEKYFEIIKRHNILLQCDNLEDTEKDTKELEALFTRVKSQITNKKYLKKYNKIQKQFAECDADTTIDINAFSENNYKAIDELLNIVYKQAQSKIDPDDLKELESSQSKWEQEVADYQKVFDAMGFGTIGASTYYSYMTNMKEFRTLLLMLYL